MSLILLTAALHFGAALDHQLFPEGPDPLFLLNGLGYLGLWALISSRPPIFQDRHKLVWACELPTGLRDPTYRRLAHHLGRHQCDRKPRPNLQPDSLYGVPAKITEVILLILLRQDKPQN